jgi:cytoskeleton protein RodZ
VASAAAAAGEASAVQGLLILRATEASWIEVVDAGGRNLLSRTVQAGEAVGLDGSPPLRLTIGNAGATQVSFRGEPVALEPHTRDNIARLVLK